MAWWTPPWEFSFFFFNFIFGRRSFCFVFYNTTKSKLDKSWCLFFFLCKDFFDDFSFQQYFCNLLYLIFLPSLSFQSYVFHYQFHFISFYFIYFAKCISFSLFTQILQLYDFLLTDFFLDWFFFVAVEHNGNNNGKLQCLLTEMYM